jgi:hypothetical protein
MTHLSPNAQQLLNLALNADKDMYTAGLVWYQQAHDFAVTIAARYGYTVTQAAGVIAALSPKMEWSKNKRAAEMALKRHSGGGVLTHLGIWQTKANISKALRILDGENPAAVLSGNMPKSGHKAYSFFDNIAFLDASREVTVDRWAIKAWKTDADTWGRTTPKRYATIKQDYTAAAVALGVMPYQLQAICWCATRGETD